jgi:hypothetical protein
MRLKATKMRQFHPLKQIERLLTLATAILLVLPTSSALALRTRNLGVEEKTPITLELENRLLENRPSHLSSAGQEEIQIYDKDGHLIARYPKGKGIPSTAFKQLDQVIVKGVKLDRNGQLKLGGGSGWMTLKDSPNAPVNVHIEKGKVVKVDILNENGNLLQELPFMRIERPDGTLVDTFYENLRSARMAKLVDQVIVKGVKLDRNGHLNLGGRAGWIRLSDFPNAPVNVYIEKGKVVKVDILNENGNLIREVPLIRIERPDGTLVDTFYELFSPARMAKLLGPVIVKGMKLDRYGQLNLGGRAGWMTLKDSPNAPVNVHIEKGKVVKVDILNEKGNLIREVPLIRIERPDGTLVDTFYENLRPARMAKLVDPVIVKGVKLDRNGRLHLGGRLWTRRSSYPNAEVEVYIEQGQVKWVKLVRDREGQPINSRTGAGFGRARYRLLPKEVAFMERLAGGFQDVGMPQEQAKKAAEILLRLKKGSLNLLKEDGLLTEQEVHAIEELDTGNLDVGELGRKLKRQIEEWQTEIRGILQDPDRVEALIDRLLTTHLIPWKTIERLQRTYRLGRDLQLIETALGHPDVEAWIKRMRETQERRGTLNEEKHLKLYTPSSPLTDRDALLNELKAHKRVLDTLLQKPEEKSYPFKVNLVTARELVIESQSTTEPVQLRRGQRVLLRVGQHESLWKVEGYLEEERKATLTPLEGSPTPQAPSLRRGQEVSLRLMRSDIPLEHQLNKIRFVIENLERSSSTGSLILDRLFGLKPLSPSPPLSNVNVQFFNDKIPYKRISDFESEGDQSQETAVKLAMNPTELLFIEGPAGTGKTTVIAEILRQAVQQGKKVLLVSQMHQAVDNAVAAVMNDPNVPVLRLGNDPNLFWSETRRVWPGNREEGVKAEVLGEFYRRLQPDSGRGFVLASTNSGIVTDWFFQNRIKDSELLPTRGNGGFDLMIMDEASRETLPGALVPLSYLKPTGKAIFVGDVKQLPPFGLTEEDRRFLRERDVSKDDMATYQKSIFEWLLTKGQGDRVMLSTNYRSHPLIAGLVSTLFYEEDVHRRGWEDFDAETLSLRVVDLAEEPDVYYERRTADGSYKNWRSAEQVLRLVRLFRERGIPLNEITVITPYLAQKNLLEDKLKEAFGERSSLPDVTTIDSYQGGENRAIIFDLVRSNKRREIGFVKDVRRLNVGLSRARENLAIIWDSRTFTGMPSESDSQEDRQARELFQKLLNYYENEVRTFFPELPELPEASAGLEETVASVLANWAVAAQGSDAFVLSSNLLEHPSATAIRLALSHLPSELARRTYLVGPKWAGLEELNPSLQLIPSGAVEDVALRLIQQIPASEAVWVVGNVSPVLPQLLKDFGISVHTLTPQAGLEEFLAQLGQALGIPIAQVEAGLEEIRSVQTLAVGA